MEGNPLLNPVGSLAPQVYWRRRLLAALLAVLLLWLCYSFFPGKGGKASAAQPKKPGKTTASALPATTQTPGPTTSTPAAPAATKTPSTPATATSPAAASPSTTVAGTAAAASTTGPAAPKCPSSGVRLTLSADHVVYPAGLSPHFVLTVANAGGAGCRIDVGTANRGFLVTSGQDRIWSSADCAKTTANVQTFKPADSVGYAATWARQRSFSSGCANAGSAARPGTYKVTAHLGDLVSSPVVFRLT